MNQAGKLTLTAPEVGQLLGISRNQVYKGVREGSIPSIRVGSKILVPVEALQRLLDSAYQSAVGRG